MVLELFRVSLWLPRAELDHFPNYTITPHNSSQHKLIQQCQGDSIDDSPKFLQRVGREHMYVLGMTGGCKTLDETLNRNFTLSA